MLASRIQAIKPSPTLALAARAKALMNQGKDVISLTVGEPDWDTFPVIKTAGISAIHSGKTKYLPTEGLLELRKLIATEAREQTGISYDPNQITVSTGAKFIIFSALECLLNPGDEVIIPAPYWVSYPDMVQLCGGQPRIVNCPRETNFKLKASMLKSVVNSKTKALILNSPNNPTGEVYSARELKEIGEVLEEFPNLFVISDDIYNRLYFKGRVADHLLLVNPKLKDRVLVVNGASKSYAMTGWRVGWALGPQWWINGMNIYQSQTVSCATSISQYAVIEALKSADEEIARVVKILQQRRDLLGELLSCVSGIQFHLPEGAFYFWVDISSFLGQKWRGQKLNGSVDFVKIFLEEYLVSAVDGLSFGMEGYMRLSYAQSEDQLKRAINRLKKFVSEIG